MLTLFRIVGWSLAEIVSQSLQPYVILFEARGERDRVIFLAAICTKITFALAVVYAALVWLFADIGSRAWLGHGMFLGYGPVACLGGAFLIDVLFLATNNFMRALNEHRALSITMGGYAALSLFLGVAGAAWWEPARPLYGLCLGLFAASLLGQLIPLPLVARRWLRISWRVYISRFLAPPSFMAVCVLVFAAAFHQATAGLATTLGAGACLTLVVLGSFLATLDQGERAWMTRAANRLLAKPL
jgi:hypothetical protein